MINLLLSQDAALDIFKGYVIYFIVVVIIVPIVNLIVYVVKSSENNFNCEQIDKKEQERQYDLNNLLSVKQKLESGYGIDSLSNEELKVLRKHNII